MIRHRNGPAFCVLMGLALGPGQAGADEAFKTIDPNASQCRSAVALSSANACEVAATVIDLMRCGSEQEARASQGRVMERAAQARRQKEELGAALHRVLDALDPADPALWTRAEEARRVPGPTLDCLASLVAASEAYAVGFANGSGDFGDVLHDLMDSAARNPMVAPGAARGALDRIVKRRFDDAVTDEQRNRLRRPVPGTSLPTVPDAPVPAPQSDLTLPVIRGDVVAPPPVQNGWEGRVVGDLGSVPTPANSRMASAPATQLHDSAMLGDTMAAFCDSHRENRTIRLARGVYGQPSYKAYLWDTLFSKDLQRSFQQGWSVQIMESDLQKPAAFLSGHQMSILTAPGSAEPRRVAMASPQGVPQGSFFVGCIRVTSGGPAKVYLVREGQIAFSGT